MATPDAPLDGRLTFKPAAAICAPQLADALLRLEARLNDMEARGEWSPEQVGAAMEDIRQPLWWMNDVMGGKRPDVHFDVTPSETVPEGISICGEVASDMANVLDNGYVRLGRLINGPEQYQTADEQRKLLRDVRYAANDLRRALEDVRPSGPQAVM